MDPKEIWIGNDHGGYQLKLELVDHLQQAGYTVVNIGSDSTEIVRYPYYAAKVAGAVAQGKTARGILICSTGIGMSIIANKYRRVRAALCTTTYMAKMTRAHNDSNILCLGGKCIGVFEAFDILDAWLSTGYEAGRHNISLGLVEEAEKMMGSDRLWEPEIPDLKEKKTMPGDANWKSLFHMEYQQLYEEGYPVGESILPTWPSPYFSFLDGTKKESDLAEQDWEKGYANLWLVRQRGLRADFPFIEPDDYESIITGAIKPPSLQALDETDYAERVKGAWYARFAGVVLGKPFEMDLDRLTIKKYLESLDAYPLDDWVPSRSTKLGMELRQDCLPSTRGHIQYVQPDDDVHYTILALLLAEKKGLDFSVMDVGENLLDNIPYHWLWSATRQAYYHFVNLDENSPLEEQIAQMATKLNPWREGLNGAIRADFWGYISPGDPRRAAKLAHQAISFNTVKNGLYGALFSAGCISTALSKNPTIETILQGGLSLIPQKSRLAAVVNDVTDWYATEKEWIPVCDKIYEKYVHLNFSESLKNMALVVLSLLEGQLDYSRTITTAVMCGQDTDCTSGTAASIVGAAIGYQNLDLRWVLPLNDRVKTVIAGFGEGTISELVKRTIQVRRQTT